MIAASLPVDATAERIWDALTTPEEMELWLGSIKNVGTEDCGPLRPGSTLIFTARNKPASSTVVEYVERRALTLRSVQGPVSATYAYRIQPGQPCQLSLEIECKASGLLKLLQPLIRRTLIKTDAPQVARIKDLVEGD